MELERELEVDDFTLKLRRSGENHFEWCISGPEIVFTNGNKYPESQLAWKSAVRALVAIAFHAYVEEEIKLRDNETTTANNVEISKMMGLWGINAITYSSWVPTFWGRAYTPHRTEKSWNVACSSLRQVASSLAYFCYSSSFHNKPQFLEGATQYIGLLNRPDLYPGPLPTILDSHEVRYQWVVEFSKAYNVAIKDDGVVGLAA